MSNGKAMVRPGAQPQMSERKTRRVAMKSLRIAGLALALAVPAGPSHAAESVNLILNWTPTADHSPFITPRRKAGTKRPDRSHHRDRQGVRGFVAEGGLRRLGVRYR